MPTIAAPDAVALAERLEVLEAQKADLQDEVAALSRDLPDALGDDWRALIARRAALNLEVESLNVAATELRRRIAEANDEEYRRGIAAATNVLEKARARVRGARSQGNGLANEIRRLRNTNGTPHAIADLQGQLAHCDGDAVMAARDVQRARAALERLEREHAKKARR